MRRWIFLTLLAAGCDDLGSVELRWDVTHNGQPSTCADVGATDVQVVFSTVNALEVLTPCNEGMDTYQADKGDTMISATLIGAGNAELATVTVPAQVTAGVPSPVDVTFDVVP
jgi:hypothetical protein